MALLTRKDILAAQDLEKELVPVPEWGGDVYVRALSASEFDRIQSEIFEMRGKRQVVHAQDFRAKVCCRAICDENGEPLFTPVDVSSLSGKSSAALARVYAVAARLSGIGEQEAADIAGEMTENPTGDSATD